MSRDAPTGARLGLAVAVVLLAGLVMVSCQAVDDAPRRVAAVPPTSSRAPAPTSTPPMTTPTEPYPGAWCGDDCRNGHLVSQDAPRTTPARRVPASTVHTVQPARPRVTGTRTAAPAPRAAVRAAVYANCAAVRAANADPIRRGQAGYARHLDRDGDGIGCE